jgi:tRNA/rRNA methyltransferase
MSYEWMKQSMESEDETLFAATEQTPATKEQLFGFFGHLEDALDARGFFRPADKKPKMIDNLRAVWSRRALTFEEIKLLRGVISSLDRFSRKHPRGTGNPEDFDD